MQRNNYMIEYTLVNKQGEIIKSGKAKMNNKINPLEAEVKFQMHMLNQYPSLGKITIHNCKNITESIF